MAGHFVFLAMYLYHNQFKMDCSYSVFRLSASCVHMLVLLKNTSYPHPSEGATGGEGEPSWSRQQWDD